MKTYFKEIKIVLSLLVLFSIIEVFKGEVLKFLGLGESILIISLLYMVDFILMFMLYIFGKRTLMYSIEQEKQYRELVEYSPEPMLIHREGTFIYVNESGAKLFGFNHPEQLLNHRIEEFIDEQSYKKLEKIERADGLKKEELTINRADGEMTDLETVSTTVEFGGGLARKVSVRDITAQNRKTNALKEVSNRDELTGLLNRRGFIEKTNSNLVKTKKVTTRLGVMFIDLDGFKQVNDTFGHEKGDLVLQRVGEYLMECVSEKDIVARLGGDEFIIFIPDANEQDCIRLAKKIIEPQNPYVTPSIGIALSPKDGRSIETLIKHADMAMYEAKKTGKNKYHFFGSDSSNV